MFPRIERGDPRNHSDSELAHWRRCSPGTKDRGPPHHHHHHHHHPSPITHHPSSSSSSPIIIIIAPSLKEISKKPHVTASVCVHWHGLEGPIMSDSYSQVLARQPQGPLRTAGRLVSGAHPHPKGASGWRMCFADVLLGILLLRG